jgi:peroxiredoxin Q/BCP
LFLATFLQPMLQPGTVAPAFTAPTSTGVPVSLDQFKGKWVALCFYPRDFTPACTAQACSLRDNYGELAALGITVIGISSDTPAEHKAFAEKYTLPYTLVSDDGSIRKAYSVPRSFLGLMPGRVTYVVDPEGKIKGAFDSQLNISGHIKAIRRLVTGTVAE